MFRKRAEIKIKNAESLIWPRDGNGVGRKVNKQACYINTLELTTIHHVADGKREKRRIVMAESLTIIQLTD